MCVLERSHRYRGSKAPTSLCIFYPIGSLFSVYGVVTAIMQLVGAAIFNNVYQATLGLTFPGLVFVIRAGLVIISFVFVR